MKDDSLLQINELPIPLEFIERRIYLVRGRKIMIDSDLAELYQVPTKRLNEQVKRNLGRFPSDFMFQFSKNELADWRSQFATSNLATKMGLRRNPYAFTEHGIAMLSSVLNSKRAIQMNIVIIRAFIHLREVLASNKDIAQKVKELERTQFQQSNKIAVIYRLVQRLIQTPEQPKNKIGFRTE